MNDGDFRAHWLQLKGKIREQWGRLTDDEVDVIDGRREQLAGLLQKRYNHTRDEAERAIRDFESRWEATSSPSDRRA
ncbi:MAG: CsbD family protein [Gemmatimonadaceae bacterium]|nr:CsbD family protein [Gemmatimonadaceae bacterium]